MRLFVVASLAAFAVTPALAQTDQARLEQCIEKIDRDAEGAYQDGLSWQAIGNPPAARQCTALALIALGEEAEGAARLEELANAPEAGSADMRAVYLTQSGNAWLLAGMAEQANVTLTNALKLRPGDGELFKDRARARVALKQWAEAGDDLDGAIIQSAGDAESFRMRGHVRLKQGRLSEAWQDVEAAMKLAPTDVNVVVLRGDVREAMRREGMEDPAGLDQALEPRARIVGN